MMPARRIFVATGTTDFRKGFLGLTAIIDGALGLDSRTGDVFVFLSRDRTQVRLLYWDRDGYVMSTKRFETGTLASISSAHDESHVRIDLGQLDMMLHGIDARVVRRRKRFSNENKDTHGS